MFTSSHSKIRQHRLMFKKGDLVQWSVPDGSRQISGTVIGFVPSESSFLRMLPAHAKNKSGGALQDYVKSKDMTRADRFLIEVEAQPLPLYYAIEARRLGKK